jgi:hypothetical protein
MEKTLAGGLLGGTSGDALRYQYSVKKFPNVSYVDAHVT